MKLRHEIIVACKSSGSAFYRFHPQLSARWNTPCKFGPAQCIILKAGTLQKLEALGIG